MIKKIKQFAARNAACERCVCIAYRVCSFFYASLFLLARIFPVKENKIVCCNMRGRRYGDNPKYILDEIIRQGLDYEMVWLMKKGYDAKIPPQIKRASYNPFSLAYHLSTAKIWIDSSMKAVGTLKRKGQCYIQTWHGSYGLKKSGFDEHNASMLFDEITYLYNLKLEDIMVSNSRKTTDIYRTAFKYGGEVLESGSPRNDIFFEDAAMYKKKIEKYFSIQGKRIILYAPTFRDDFRTECMHMDFEKIIEAFGERFGGEWVMLVRLHPQNIRDAEGFLSYSDHLINATSYNVMQELLVASDVLITDYSSCMFDFVTTGKPCFIYATDIDQYKAERDFYFDIMELPFPVAQSSDELVENILHFDEGSYHHKLEALFEQVGLCDKGTACRQVVEYIRNIS